MLRLLQSGQQGIKEPFTGGKVAHRGVVVDGKTGGVLEVAHLGEQFPCTFLGRIISRSGQSKLPRVFLLHGADPLGQAAGGPLKVEHEIEQAAKERKGQDQKNPGCFIGGLIPFGHNMQRG